MYHIFLYRCVGQRESDDSYGVGSDIIFIIQERYRVFQSIKFGIEIKNVCLCDLLAFLFLISKMKHKHLEKGD